MRNIKSRLSLLALEKSQVDGDKGDQIKAKAHLELIIKDLEDNLKNDMEINVSFYL